MIDERFAIAAAGAGWPLALPGAVRATLEGIAAREGTLPEVLASHYLDRMPAALVRQLWGEGADPILWRRLEAAPRLRAALAGIHRVLGADAPALLGAPSPEALLAARPSPAELYRGALFGTSAPLLGAAAHERQVIAADVAAGRGLDDALDLRLSGNLVHELCHGRPGLAPWTVLESAALYLGALARPEHIFPDERGEAVPGVSLFVLVGEGLARLLGPAWLWGTLLGRPVTGPLAEAGWRHWRRRRTAPFVIDALDAVAWIKLAAGAPDLDAAEATPWSELAWFHDEPTDADRAMVATGVRALFQVNVYTASFQTRPAELPGRRLWVDVERCAVQTAVRPEGVFAEPARWVFPPPLARRLAARGARRIVVEGATRAAWAEIARTLVELAEDGGALGQETILVARRPT